MRDRIGTWLPTLSRVHYPWNDNDVYLRAGSIGTTSATWQLGLHRQNDGALVAIGQFVHVSIDADTKRPVPIPHALRSRVEDELLVAARQATAIGAAGRRRSKRRLWRGYRSNTAVSAILDT